MADRGESTAVRITVRNMGGIDSHQVTFDRGVTVLTGHNATNRTSLLQAISAGLGGSYGELKRDADVGEVELTFGDDQYSRTFQRVDDDVTVTGTPYTENEVIVDQFSSLLEINPARQAVQRGDGDALRETIMKPIDTAQIRAEIEDRQRELREIDDRIDELERRRSNISALKQRQRETEADLESVSSELADVRTTVAEFEADVDAAEAAEAVVEELRETRTEYERIRNRRQTQEHAVESLESEREQVSDELTESGAPRATLEAARDERERLQRRQRRLENTIADLMSIVEFNERLVGDGADAVAADAESGRGIQELDPETETVECWTCGTTVERGDIEDRLDGLRDVVEDYRSERNELRTQIDERRGTIDDLRGKIDDHESLAAKLDEIDAEIDERTSRIEELSAREADVHEEIQELEREASKSEPLRDSELLTHYERLSELEYERRQLAEQLESLEVRIDEREALGDELDECESEREMLRTELTSVRNQIDDLERSAIDTFNEHMETVLDRLDYANVERVWIERVIDGSQRGSTSESTFVLHIVRSGDGGTVYEDTVDHLSESEREVIGMIVALAGYLVHDVHDVVPMMMLDSLESIDASRISALVDYFADYAPFLVVALLPADARALDGEYDRVVMDTAAASDQPNPSH